MDEDEITLPNLPLKTFLQDKLYYEDNAYIYLPLGEVISLIDHDEQLCHVEFYSKDKVYFDIPFEHNPTKDKPAVIWRIDAWRKSVKLYEIRKQQAEERLQKDFIYKEKFLLLMKAIKDKTSLTDELVEPLVKRILDSDNKIAARNFGVEI